MQFSPIKIIAGLVAVGLSSAVLFYGSNARQATADLMSLPRLKPKTNAQPAPADTGARPSAGVIPIGVVSAPSAASAGR